MIRKRRNLTKAVTLILVAMMLLMAVPTGVMADTPEPQEEAVQSSVEESVGTVVPEVQTTKLQETEPQDAEIPETEPPAEEAVFETKEETTAERPKAAPLKAAGGTSDFWADPNWGAGDVLYYGTVNGTTTPAYCIDHGADVPASYYTQIDPVFYANQLGYVMKHGYPNENWGLSGPEAQFLTQSAVYDIIGVDMWNIENGMQPPSYVYNALWGNGNFSIATNLASQARSNATSADASYVRFWYPTGNPSSQRVITPLPYVPEGYLNITKSISRKTGDIKLVKESAVPDATDGNKNYSLEGAEYGIYSDMACTQLVGTMTTDSNGVAEYKGLDLKLYYVKEMAASKGFRLSSEIIAYDLRELEKKYALDAVYTVSGNGKTYTLTCNASTGKSNTLTLEEGTYTITESSAATGTVRNNGSQKVTIKSEQTTSVTSGIAVDTPIVFEVEKTTKEDPLMIPVGLLLMKPDKETEKQSPQGDAALENARFLVKYYDDLFAKGEEEPSRPVRNWTFKSDAEGEVRYTDDPAYFVSGSAIYKNKNGEPALPIGTITVLETTAPEGYLLNEDLRIMTIELEETAGTVKAVLTIHDEVGNVIDEAKMTVQNEKEDLNLVYPEQVKRGGVSVQKISKETGLAYPQGGATLAGAKITIYNASKYPVVVGEEEYYPGTAVLTIETDENGFAQSGEKDLPYGTYYVVEEERPEGYLLNEGWKVYFEIREDGKIVDLSADPLEDQIARRGFEFKKTIEGEERVANCLFEVTMTATGETHYIVTGPNGIYNSRKFEANNKNDEAVTKNEDGSYTVDESKLSYKNNVWFSMDSEGNVVDPTKGYDAFVYGEYEFKEIRTSANVGLNLITFHGYVYEEDYYLENDGLIYDLGTKDDKEINIGTTATDAEDGDKFVSKTGQVKIMDRVEYSGLTKGKEYTVEGTLFNKATGTLMTDADGNEITSSVTFTAKGKSGHVDVEFVFDGILLTETNEIVVFENLYEDGQLAVVHNNPDDADQTVEVEEPEIGTTLIDKQTGGHKASASEDITLVDTISYKNLKAGETYTAEGILMDKETGEPVLDDEGNEIKASVKFVAAEKDGTVNVVFTFSGINLSGKQVVAFEKVLYEDREVAVHADLEDVDQTVEMEEPVKPEEPAPSDTPDYPKTGDEANMILWGMLACIALLAGCGIAVYLKIKTSKQ